MISKHSHLTFFFAILMGFTLAFALLFSLTISIPLAGNIIIGGIPVSREYPTITSAALHTKEMQAATMALASFWFWIGVSALGAFFTLEIWKWVRG